MNFTAPFPFMVLILPLLGDVFHGSPLQADDGDWQNWNEVSWTQNVGSGLDVSLREETRFTQDFSQFSYYEVEPSIWWRYSPRWDFGIGYERDEQLRPTEDVMHAPNVNTSVKLSMRDWELQNRSRMEFNISETSDSDWQPVYRNQAFVKTCFRVGSNGCKPFLSQEWFYNLRTGSFIQNRLSIGMEIPVGPHWKIQAYWMRLDEKTVRGWEWHPVLGFRIQTQF